MTHKANFEIEKYTIRDNWFITIKFSCSKDSVSTDSVSMNGSASPYISAVSNPNFQQDTSNDTLKNKVNAGYGNEEVTESLEAAENTTIDGIRTEIIVAAATTASAVNIVGDSVEESRRSEGPSSLSSEFDISSKVG